MIHRTWFLPFVAVLSLGASSLPADTPAVPAQQADPIDLECVDAATLRFDPGLTPEPQPQTITGTLVAGTKANASTPCSSTQGVPFQGATGTIQGSGVLGCAAAPAVMEAHGTVDVVWDTGETSVAEWSMATYGAVPTVTARFVKGPLKGSDIVQEAAPTGVTGNCGEEPLKQGGFTGVVEVICPSACDPPPA